MAEKLCSVGLDVGTTTTQMILSELTVENRASAFAVPEMEITGRKILYESPVRFTPLLGGELVDGKALRDMVSAEYAAAGIRREQVDTGAVIITGETSRKENARAVLENLSGFAGDFVVAAAGPDLESALAAKGAGAVEYSEKTGKTVLHMDIGGGTANLALIREGKIRKTGCLNVGGRLLKFDGDGRITYVSPVLEGLTELKIGELPRQEQVDRLARVLTAALEMAAGLREADALLEKLSTREASGVFRISEPAVISLSGGVADCVEKPYPPNAFGDMGPALGRAIRESRLWAAEHMLGSRTIRATVIGAGCHSTGLSGSTVYSEGVSLPVRDLPVVEFGAQEQTDPQLIRQRLSRQEGLAVLAMPGYDAPSYGQVAALADAIAAGAGEGALYICLRADMAKALGHALGLRRKGPCLCIDRLALREGDYLDIGNPVGPALPVVIKTLILSGGG